MAHGDARTAPDDFASDSLDSSSRAPPVGPLILGLIQRASAGPLFGWVVAGHKEQGEDERRRAGSRAREAPAHARTVGTRARALPLLAGVREGLQCRRARAWCGAGRAARGQGGPWGMDSRVRGAGLQKLAGGALVVRPGRHAAGVRRAGCQQRQSSYRDCGMCLGLERSDAQRRSESKARVGGSRRIL